MNRQQILYDAARKCVGMVQAAGIPCVRYADCEFRVNTRAKSRWGQCCRKNGEYSINIAAVLLDGKHSDGLENTLIHELLHTCEGCMNHGERWKGYAEIIRRKYGVDIQRCDDYRSKGFTENPLRVEMKYRYVCEGCGQVVGKTRACDFTRNYSWKYRCGCCGGKIQDGRGCRSRVRHRSWRWNDEQTEKGTYR